TVVSGDVSGDARGGGPTWSTVKITTADFDYSGPAPVLRAFAVEFEQRSGAPTNPALRGTLADFRGTSGDPADEFVEHPGGGTDTVISLVTYALPDNFENLTLTGPFPSDGTGNTANNVITGNSTANVLSGLAGNDTLIGGGGDDTIDGGAGADTAIFSGPRAYYGVTVQPDGSFRIVDQRPGSPEGTDVVRNVETFKFADEVYRPVNDQAPVVTVLDASVNWGQPVAVSSLFTAADPDGDPIVLYKFVELDTSPASGRFNNTNPFQSERFYLPATGHGLTGWLPSSLPALTFVGGTDAGTQTLLVAAFDGTQWSNWAQVRITTVGSAPDVTAIDRTVRPGQTVPIPQFFTVADADGSAVTAYQFQADSQSGRILVNGVEQSPFGPVTVVASSLATVSFRVGSDYTGSGYVTVRATD